MTEIVLPTTRGQGRQEELTQFSEQLKALSDQIGFKISPRGWCYQLESAGLIDKGKFNVVEGLIHDCMRLGLLPIDFVAEEDARAFSGVEEPDGRTPAQYLAAILQAGLNAEELYTPDWWSGEDYYIQMVVEKIDLKTLFKPVCEKFHVPIATSKGWSSMLQRAIYARRFQEAEEMDLKPVLLYCGDHDPDGLRISEFLMSNLNDLKDVVWSDGTPGYDPSNLTIFRFGLNYDFIEEHGLSWIPNLITGSKKDLSDPEHRNHHLPYVQDYLKTIGVRKCEANALVVQPDAARSLCESAIIRYVGEEAEQRFEERREEVREQLKELDHKTHYRVAINKVIKQAEP
jgi:hypothetical protein